MAGITRTGSVLLNNYTAFVKSGTLTTGTGVTRFPLPVNAAIVHVRLACRTAPTTSAIIVDINKNGTTIFTTQANRPQIAATTNASTVHNTPDITALVAGDYLTMDIDQIGSGTAGADLTAVVYFIG